MSFDKDLAAIMKQEPVSVFLTNDDQMCLRRLMEHDTHEPGDLTAAEAQSGVVGMAVQWAATTFMRLLRTDGDLVLHYKNGREKQMDWLGMIKEAIADEAESNMEIMIWSLTDIPFMDTLCEAWETLLGQPVTRSSIIRFAIRWRHYSLRMWIRHQKKRSEPELGIRFGKGRGSKFGPITI